MSETDSLERRRYEIRGRVQGVGFRYWATIQAAAIGLIGTIMNRADGAVEMEVAGTADQIARMEGLLSVGPPAARVDRVVELPPSTRELGPDLEVLPSTWT